MLSVASANPNTKKIKQIASALLHLLQDMPDLASRHCEVRIHHEEVDQVADTGKKEERKRKEEEAAPLIPEEERKRKERGKKEERKRKERGKKEERKRKERGKKEERKRKERGRKEEGKRKEEEAQRLSFRKRNGRGKGKRKGLSLVWGYFLNGYR